MIFFSQKSKVLRQRLQETIEEGFLELPRIQTGGLAGAAAPDAATRNEGSP